jgi:SAM-dependent methyltransferase
MNPSTSTSPSGTANAVRDHYGRPKLTESILETLGAAPGARLSIDDLSPVDQFHVRGRDATRELARSAGFARGQHIVDVGGGLGGAARVLAGEFGCDVTVLDLTDEYCRAGEVLTERCGLAGQVHFRLGDALAMPFADGQFDAAWTQHSTMNIADKPRLYREIRRVLRPSGKLAMHEIVAGPGGPPIFPAPWARTPDTSHLLSQQVMRETISGAGFTAIEWIDDTQASLAWIESRLAAPPAATPGLGFHLLMGADIRLMLDNLLTSLRQKRIEVVRALFRADAD